MIALILGVTYMGIEYWLGKTEKVRGGSVLEVALSLSKAAIGLVLKK